MVDSDRRRFLKYAFVGGIGGGLVTTLTDGDSETGEREGDGSDTELESASNTQTQETNTAEDSISVENCRGRREIGRGEEDLECSSRKERIQNITEDYSERYGDRSNWPTQRGDE
jgi:hypothetical protein